jgi:hypothetical protein
MVELPYRSFLLLATALAVGCTEPQSPTPQSSPGIGSSSPPTTLTQADLQGARGRGLDAEFTRLARAIPGFAGMYYDRSGKLTVNLKAPAGAAALRASDVVGQLRARGNPGVQQRLNTATAVATKAVQYDYAELQAYRGRLSRIFDVKGVVFTDTDEEANRVRIGIEPGAREQEVIRALAKAGVPREAVKITRSSAIREVRSLQEGVRPIPGGFQIAFRSPDPRFFFICTLGFNARLPGRSAEFFVTNSHCSDQPGGDQDTRYFQEFPQPEDRIALEFLDPRFGNPGDLCIYVGFRCRLSDALLARYTSNNLEHFGTIARTTFGGQRIGSLTVNRDNPRWHIVTEFGFPFLGEIAHKVGRSTGWTFGPVIETCVDLNSSGTDRVLLCQDIVLAGSGFGDSGAPVFERLGGSDVALTGILWGAGTNEFGAPVFAFSALENIVLELGALSTF